MWVKVSILTFIPSDLLISTWCWRARGVVARWRHHTFNLTSCGASIIRSRIAVVTSFTWVNDEIATSCLNCTSFKLNSESWRANSTNSSLSRLIVGQTLCTLRMRALKNCYRKISSFSLTWICGTYCACISFKINPSAKRRRTRNIKLLIGTSWI